MSSRLNLLNVPVYCQGRRWRLSKACHYFRGGHISNLMSLYFAYEVTAIHDILVKRPSLQHCFETELRRKGIRAEEVIPILDRAAAAELGLSAGRSFVNMVLSRPTYDQNGELHFSFEISRKATIEMKLLGLFRHYLAHRTDKTESWEAARARSAGQATRSELVQFGKLSRLSSWTILLNAIERYRPFLIRTIRIAISQFVKDDREPGALLFSEMRVYNVWPRQKPYFEHTFLLEWLFRSDNCSITNSARRSNQQ